MQLFAGFGLMAGPPIGGFLYAVCETLNLKLFDFSAISYSSFLIGYFAVYFVLDSCLRAINLVYVWGSTVVIRALSCIAVDSYFQTP